MDQPVSEDIRGREQLAAMLQRLQSPREVSPVDLPESRLLEYSLGERFLDSLEQVAERALSQFGEPLPNTDYGAIQSFLDSFVLNRLQVVRLSTDFSLELRDHQRIFTKENYPCAWNLWRTIPGGKR